MTPTPQSALNDRGVVKRFENLLRAGKFSRIDELLDQCRVRSPTSQVRMAQEMAAKLSYQHREKHRQAIMDQSPALMRRLHALGADPNGTYQKHDQPLLVSACCSDNLPLATTLLELGANANPPHCERGMTPLMSCSDDHVEMAALLLAYGAGVDAIDHQGFTALSWAALTGQVNIMRRLVEHGADPLHRDQHDNTALHLAAGTSRVDIPGSRVPTLVQLLQWGVDPEATNDEGQRAEQRAIEVGAQAEFLHAVSLWQGRRLHDATAPAPARLQAVRL